MNTFTNTQRHFPKVCSFLLLIAVTAAASGARSQTSLSGDLVQRIDSLISTMPRASSVNKYVLPAPAELTEWSSAYSFIIQGRYQEADSSASLIGYDVILFTDNATFPSHSYVLLEEIQGNGKYWGTYAVDPTALRPNLAIQSPHPLHDSNTGRQAIRMFKNTGAGAFFISGAHRCNNGQFSSCSGTTTVCSSTPEAFRISDQAHVVNGMFQATTQVLSSFFPEMCFVHVHGFAKQASDPDLIMSYGTSLPPPGDDKLVQLRDNFSFEDASLTFKVAHVDSGWTRLIATTNTQGRYLNGSPNPCNQSASSCSGRFMHIEQGYAKLRDSPANWTKFSNALANTFQQVSYVADPQVSLPGRVVLHPNYPNPFNPSTTISYSLEREAELLLEVRNILGQTVAVLVDGVKPAGLQSVIFNAENLPSGVYFVSLKNRQNTQTRSMLLLR
jgi:hypothetical protein